MANIPNQADIARKWTARASQSSNYYTNGVQNPRRSWADSAAAANETYTTAVTEAAQAGRFAAGVRKAGEAKWQQNAVQKGPSRYTQGVQVGQDAYTKGFAPYHQAIESVQLPPRFPRGDPRNFDRVRAIGQALNQRRQQELGS
jgi:hypothetical protein